MGLGGALAPLPTLIQRGMCRFRDCGGALPTGVLPTMLSPTQGNADPGLAKVHTSYCSCPDQTAPGEPITVVGTGWPLPLLTEE